MDVANVFEKNNQRQWFLWLHQPTGAVHVGKELIRLPAGITEAGSGYPFRGGLLSIGIQLAAHHAHLKVGDEWLHAFE